MFAEDVELDFSSSDVTSSYNAIFACKEIKLVIRILNLKEFSLEFMICLIVLPELILLSF